MTLGKTLTDDEKRLHQQLQQLQQENELASLRKQYLILDSDFQRCTHSKGKELEKYNKIFEVFYKEHGDILLDLSIAGAESKKREDSKLTEQLEHLLGVGDYYAHKAKELKLTVRQIEDQIKRVKRNVVVLTSKQVTDQQHLERAHQAQKTIELLENRLELQMIRFGSICTQNAKLREQIDRLICDRHNFLRHWTKLLEKLVKGKQIMLDLIEQATIAYDQREEWCNKLQALRIKAHLDHTKHVEQMRNLAHSEDNYSKIRHFLHLKSQKRTLKDLLVKKQVRQDRLQNELADKLQQYRQIRDEIFNFTKTPKLMRIAREFAIQQEENFMYFNIINDHIAEMDTAEEPLSKLYMEIEDLNLVHSTRAKAQQNRLEQLERTLIESTEQCQSSEKKYNQTCTQLKALMQGIEMLFQMTRCNKDPLLKLLGDHSSVNQFNVLLYLGMLESKMHQVLLWSHFKLKTETHKVKTRETLEMKIRAQFDSDLKSELYPIEKIAPSNPCPICVEQEMVSQDSIDKLQKVWSREQAKVRLARRLALPDGLSRIHNISKCHLPKAREIIQKRYT